MSLLSFDQFLRHTAEQGEAINTVFEERWCDDLDAIEAPAARHGFRFRLVFSGELTSAEQALPNPPIPPERQQIHGGNIMVIRVQDLVYMKRVRETI